MKTVYRVTIWGVTLESRDLKQLLARAVKEKRSMDQKAQQFWRMRGSTHREYSELPVESLAAGGAH